MTIISSSVVPTGGAVLLQIKFDSSLNPNTAEIAIYRDTNPIFSSATMIYSGLATPVYIDDGDLLPNYLDFQTAYYYKVITASDTTVTSGIVPGASITIQEGYLNKLLFRLFSAGVNSIVIPEGFPKIRVLQSMPLTWGSELLPIVVMNLDLEQQSSVQIGEGVPALVINNQWIIPRVVFKRYSISILSLSVAERNFFREACLGVVYSIIQTLNVFAQDISVSYQIAQTQTAGDLRSPAFYETQIMLDIEGIFNTIVNTSFSLITSLTQTMSAAVDGTIQSLWIDPIGTISSSVVNTNSGFSVIDTVFQF